MGPAESRLLSRTWATRAFARGPMRQPPMPICGLAPGRGGLPGCMVAGEANHRKAKRRMLTAAPGEVNAPARGSKAQAVAHAEVLGPHQQQRDAVPPVE